MTTAEPDRGEELASALTHGAGLLASLLGAAVLIPPTARSGDPWRAASAAAFCAALVLVYAASTLYHAARSPSTRARLQVLDHCAIFALIAGTYTPFSLVSMRAGLGWLLFAASWGLAAVGIAHRLAGGGRSRVLSTALYLVAGWLAVVAAGSVVRDVPAPALGWLVAGGLAYTVGAGVYHRRFRYAHPVWHLFVLAGSGCHFAAVAGVVLPGTPGGTGS